MKETFLFCTFCENEVIEDLPGWYACNCHSALPEEGYEYWVSTIYEEPYDTLEEKWL